MPSCEHLSPPVHLLVDWRKCFCVMIWLGISSDLRSNDPCWRCFRSRFGGAILLTRSLLRQAVSNTARRCVISSKAGPCQTVGDLHINILFFFYCYWIWQWRRTKGLSWQKIQHIKHMGFHCFSFVFSVCVYSVDRFGYFGRFCTYDSHALDKTVLKT